MDSELHTLLSNSNAGRLSRSHCAEYLIDNPASIPEALELAAKSRDPIHVSAWWALELTAEYDIWLFKPFAGKIINILPNLYHESALRSAFKLSMLMVRHFGKGQPLGIVRLQKLCDICFDLLVHDHKVASKVFAMRTLGELSKYITRIPPILTEIIQKDYGTQSAGYKTAARDVLKKLTA